LSPKTKRLFLWFTVAFFILFIVLLLISLIHNFNRPKLISLPTRELRGIWLSRFDYCERFKTHDQDSIKQFIAQSFQKIKDANFNVVFFQVRGNADAFYQSRYEPWSQMLTGELGKNPGWDPLDYAIKTAHALDLELHAWINVFPAWRGTQKPQRTNPPHPFLRHPEWVVCDSNGTAMPQSDHYVSFSPGIPQVRHHITTVIADIVRRYDVDGIHFDYVRYPEDANTTGYSHDRFSLQQFKKSASNPMNLDWADWQRDQVTLFVAEAYDKITNLKPWVKVSAAVIGNYKTSAWNGYNVVFQDARRWAEIGKIDYLIPMIYHRSDQAQNIFPQVLKEWNSIIAAERPVFPGIGAFLLEWNEIVKEIHDVRNNQFHGLVIFAFTSLNDDDFEKLKTGEFKYRALLPHCPWKSTQPVAPPTDFCLTLGSPDTLKFTWRASQSRTLSNSHQKYVIYSSKKLPIDITKAENIFAVIDGNTNVWTASKAILEKSFHYTITCIDEFENESTPVAPIKLE